MLTSNNDDEYKNKQTASPSPASQNAVKQHYAIKNRTEENQLITRNIKSAAKLIINQRGHGERGVWYKMIRSWLFSNHLYRKGTNKQSCAIIMLLFPLCAMQEGRGRRSRIVMLLALGSGEVGRYLLGR